MSLIDIGLPSWERPFGIHLFPIYDAAYKSITGYSASTFHFTPPSTPVSTLQETLGIIAAYYAVLYFGSQHMADRKPYRLNIAFQIHNVFLTLVSGALLLLFIEQLIPYFHARGLFYTVCNSETWEPKMVSLYYINYLLKYVELIDTVFLVLKKKPLTFLHTYHHGATAFLCFSQLVGHTTVSWVPIVINLFVHVVMYWYYFLSARGIRVWWKEWITRLQITQFVVGLGFIYFASYTYFVERYFNRGRGYPYLFNTKGMCGGDQGGKTDFAAGTGVAIISSYLVLFVAFYIDTYRKGAKRAAAKRAESKKEL